MSRRLSTRRLSRRAVIAAGVGGLRGGRVGCGLRRPALGRRRAARISPGSVGRRRSRSRARSSAEIPVGFSSPLIAAGEGAVWVVDPEGEHADEDRSGDERRRLGAERYPGRRDSDRAGRRRGVGLDRHERRTRSQRARARAGAWGSAPTGSPWTERDRVPVSLDPVKLAVGGGAVWALERGAGELDADRSGDGQAEAARGGPRRLVVDRGRPRRGLARRPRRRERSSTLHTGFELGEHVADRRRCTRRRTTSIAVGRDAVWFVGESSARLWRIRPADRDDPRTPSAIGTSPSAVAVAEDGAVWVASSARHLALALRSRDERPRRRSSSARPRSASWPRFGRIWTSPGAAGDVAAPFRFPDNCSRIGRWVRRLGLSLLALGAGVALLVSAAFAGPHSAVAGAAARSGSCGAQSPSRRPCPRLGNVGSWTLLYATCAKLFNDRSGPGDRQDARRSRGRAELRGLRRRPDVHLRAEADVPLRQPARR